MLSIPYETQVKIVQRADAGNTLIHAEDAIGGGSAQVILLHIRHDSAETVRPYLLRVHSENNRWRNPDIARDESRLLTTLYDSGLPVARSYYLDESGGVYPLPYLIVSYIEGATDFSPHSLPDYIRQSAELLAQIHQVKSLAALDFLSKRAEHVLWWLQYHPEQLDEALDEGRLRATLPTLFPLAKMNDAALLHGDFWAGNLIWQDGQLAGVIDWEDAETGDPLSDLGIARLDMLWTFGQDAMLDFTRTYQALMPQLDYTNLPAWDLFSALRPANQLDAATWVASGRPDITLDGLREAHRWFVHQAFEQLK